MRSLLPYHTILQRTNTLYFLAWHLTLVYKKWPAKEPKLNDEGMTLATYRKTVPYNARARKIIL